MKVRCAGYYFFFIFLFAIASLCRINRCCHKINLSFRPMIVYRRLRNSETIPLSLYTWYIPTQTRSRSELTVAVHKLPKYGSKSCLHDFGTDGKQGSAYGIYHVYNSKSANMSFTIVYSLPNILKHMCRKLFCKKIWADLKSAHIWKFFLSDNPLYALFG